MTDGDFEQKLQRLIDKDEIVDLVHRYSYCVDHRLHDQVIELFIEDCVVDYGPGFGPPIRGREALLTFLGGGRQSTGTRPGFQALSHHNANVLVTFEGDDRACLRTSLYAWHKTMEGETPQLWGYYHDVAVRTSMGWQFASRQIRVAGQQGFAIEWLPLGEDGDSKA
jgi:hypothetical protein